MVLIIGLWGLLGLLLASPSLHVRAAEPGTQQTNRDILVEITLEKARKDDLPAIRNAFEALSITKVRTQFFRLGHPPTNIGIGPNIPADVARLTIQLANQYNGGITRLLPSERLAKNYLAIGSSIFDEFFQVPVSPDEVTQLSDPSLSTEQFHALYHRITEQNRRRY